MSDIRTSALGGIPFGNNASRPTNPSVGQPYFNGQESRLEIYTGIGGGTWQNIVAETPGVVSVQGVVRDTNTVNNLTISGTNFFSGAIASIIGTNGVEINASSTVVNSIVSISATFEGISSLHEPYDVKVTNVSNLYGLLADALYVNDTPTWVTNAGNLATILEGDVVNVQVTAFDDNEGVPLTYAVSSGSLPSGVSLNSSTGAITGTAPTVASNTTYTFSITATDGVNTSSARSFNIVVNTITVEALVVAGGGGGGFDRGAGGGAGGLIDHPSYPINRATPYSISVGNGGTAGINTSVNGGLGGNSVFDTLTALGGGGGGFTGSGLNGGSGGGAGWNNSSPGAGLQSSQSGDSGTYGYGNPGGAGGASNVIGGGGGAGAAGSSSAPTTSSNRPNGGIGRQSGITGSATHYAGGGGGGQAFDGPNGNTTPYYYLQGFGGTGGGGNGGNTNGGSGFPGTPNTGGGGGGGANIPQGVGAAGGSGVVIIAYPNSLPALTVSNGLTYDQPTRTGYRVYRFTAGTGTITL